MDNNPKITLVNWNANGLLRQLPEFKHFLHDRKIDIACVTETHLVFDDKINIPGYAIYRKDRISLHKGGGVAIIIKRKLVHTKISVPTSQALEMVAIQISLSIGKINLIAAYKPPNKLLPINILKTIFTNNDKIVLMGDLNAKHTAWGCRTTTPQGTALFNISTTENWTIHAPSQPTYYPYNKNISPDILDIILTQNINSPIFQYPIPALNSDHDPVITTFHKISPTVHSYNSLINGPINWNHFQTNITNFDTYPDKLNTAEEIDLAISNFENNIRLAVQLSSVKQHTHNKIKTNQIPVNLMNLITYKHRVRRIWQITRNPTAKSTLNALTRKVKYKLKIHRHSQFDNFTSQLQPNSSSLWSAIKLITNEKQQILTLKSGNTIATTDQEKAEALAAYFESSFSNNTHLNSSFTNYISRELNKPFYTVPERIKFISPSEIKYLINKLKNKKSPGIDKIPNIVIKKLPPKVISSLTSIYNSCLRINYFPKSWKTAVIIPIAKPNKDHTKVENYRPISLLPTLSKIFEKAILTRLNKFLALNNVIPNEQFGFRNNHSTAHQLLRLTDYIASNFQKSKHTLALFLDIEKAFDRVWHNGLRFKMRQIGIPHYLQQIIKSFLTSRSFSVQINAGQSTIHPICAGVPQGSTLSPTLFNIFISDAPTLTNSKIAFFADDTAVFTAHKNLLSGRDILQADLNTLSNWLQNWNITVNSNKCQAKVFTLKRLKQIYPLILNNKAIQWLPSTTPAKYLGLLIDRRLTWKDHVSKIANNTHVKMLKLYPLINKNSKLPIESSLSIFKYIIRPSLTYACQIWGGTAPSNFQKLQVIQNKFLRWTVKAPWFIRNDQIHHELQIDTLKTWVTKLSSKFYSNLQMCPATRTFSLGKSAHPYQRIKTRYSKDMLHPP